MASAQARAATAERRKNKRGGSSGEPLSPHDSPSLPLHQQQPVRRHAVRIAEHLEKLRPRQPIAHVAPHRLMVVPRLLRDLHDRQPIGNLIPPPHESRLPLRVRRPRRGPPLRSPPGRPPRPCFVRSLFGLHLVSDRRRPTVLWNSGPLFHSIVVSSTPLWQSDHHCPIFPSATS